MNFYVEAELLRRKCVLLAAIWKALLVLICMIGYSHGTVTGRRCVVAFATRRKCSSMCSNSLLRSGRAKARHRPLVESPARHDWRIWTSKENNDETSTIDTDVKSSSVCAHGSLTTRVTEDMSHLSARSAVDTLLFPVAELDRRLDLGNEALGLDPGQVVTAQDPRLSLTYAEFPTDSFEMLLRASFKHLPSTTPTQRRMFIDIGSGTGRLVWHAALMLACNQQQDHSGHSHTSWDVHGIEISSTLHAFAVDTLHRAASQNLLHHLSHTPYPAPTTASSSPQVCFHQGDVHHQQMAPVLSAANLIFAYSTAFASQQFSVEQGALLLADAWSSTLAHRCQKGTVVITTDRVLDAKYGWKVLEQHEVDNPELWGSVGYIHVLQ